MSVENQTNYKKISSANYLLYLLVVLSLISQIGFGLSALASNSNVELPRLHEAKNHQSIYWDFKKIWEDSTPVSENIEPGEWRLVTVSGGHTPYATCSELYNQIISDDGLKFNGKRIFLKFSIGYKENLVNLTQLSRQPVKLVNTFNFPTIEYDAPEQGPFHFQVANGGLIFKQLLMYQFKQSRVGSFNGQLVNVPGSSIRAYLDFNCRMVRRTKDSMICKASVSYNADDPFFNVPWWVSRCSSDSQVLPVYLGFKENR